MSMIISQIISITKDNTLGQGKKRFQTDAKVATGIAIDKK